jgi:hypothetical protein
MQDLRLIASPRLQLERRLVLKMDFAILTFGVMAFFLKYLDSSNIKNACQSAFILLCQAFDFIL